MYVKSEMATTQWRNEQLQTGLAWKLRETGQLPIVQNVNVNFWQQITELATVLACLPSPLIITRNAPTYDISIIHTSPPNPQTLYL